MWQRELFSKFGAKFKAYVKEDWGLPLIAGFIVLLFVAVLFLVSANVLGVGTKTGSWFASSADFTATCAYFALVAGVVLQLVGFCGRKMQMAELH